MRFASLSYFKFNTQYMFDIVEQGSATCGPRVPFVRPGTSIKKHKNELISFLLERLSIIRNGQHRLRRSPQPGLLVTMRPEAAKGCRPLL